MKPREVILVGMCGCGLDGTGKADVMCDGFRDCCDVVWDVGCDVCCSVSLETYTNDDSSHDLETSRLAGTSEYHGIYLPPQLMLNTLNT